MNLQTDRDIDRTLAALQRSTSPGGMEQRILASLRQHERHVPAARGWLFTAGLATAAALAALSILTHRHAPTAPVQQTRLIGPKSPGAPSQPALSAEVETYVRTRQLPLRYGSSSQKVIPDAVQNPGSCLSVCDNPSPESHLASFPAPEAPLTEQEKLLLRIAHHPTPEEFSLLNPETIEREIAQNDLDFNQFFPPPPPIVQPIPQESTDEVHPSQR